ncbi:MAG: hypothetical protein RL095_1860 [Verrucomicrobiota bacterium]|jgi:hypothetical protein
MQRGVFLMFLGAMVLAAEETLPAQKSPAAIVSKRSTWLQREQNPDGSWGGTHRLALTAWIHLGHLARGETPHSRSHGATMEKSVDFLLAAARARLKMPEAKSPTLEDALLLHALAEHYSMSGDYLCEEVVMALTQHLARHFAAADFSVETPASLILESRCVLALKAAKVGGVDLTIEQVVGPGGETAGKALAAHLPKMKRARRLSELGKAVELTLYSLLEARQEARCRELEKELLELIRKGPALPGADLDLRSQQFLAAHLAGGELGQAWRQGLEGPLRRLRRPEGHWSSRDFASHSLGFPRDPNEADLALTAQMVWNLNLCWNFLPSVKAVQLASLPPPSAEEIESWSAIVRRYDFAQLPAQARLVLVEQEEAANGLESGTLLDGLCPAFLIAETRPGKGRVWRDGRIAELSWQEVPAGKPADLRNSKMGYLNLALAYRYGGAELAKQMATNQAGFQRHWRDGWKNDVIESVIERWDEGIDRDKKALAIELLEILELKLKDEQVDWVKQLAQMSLWQGDFPELVTDAFDLRFAAVKAAATAKVPEPGSVEDLLLIWSRRSLPFNSRCVGCFDGGEDWGELAPSVKRWRQPAGELAMKSYAAIPELLRLAGDPRPSAQLEGAVMRRSERLLGVGELAREMIAIICGSQAPEKWDDASLAAWWERQSKREPLERLKSSCVGKDSSGRRILHEGPLQVLRATHPEEAEKWEGLEMER